MQLQFYKHFSNKPFFDHLPWRFEDAFFFIDNKFRDPVVFEKVEVEQKAAKGIIEQECCISYLKFETKLLQISKNKSIISLQEVQNVAMETSNEQENLD